MKGTKNRPTAINLNQALDFAERALCAISGACRVMPPDFVRSTVYRMNASHIAIKLYTPSVAVGKSFPCQTTRLLHWTLVRRKQRAMRNVRSAIVDALRDHAAKLEPEYGMKLCAYAAAIEVGDGQ